MAKQRRRKQKTHPPQKKARSLGRRQRRQRGLPERGAQVQTTRLISGPLGMISDDECECVICEVLREELGEVPAFVDMAELSPEGRARIDAVPREPWNPF